MQTMKVKPWAEAQGDHVVINARDYDADVHESLDPAETIVGDSPGEALPSPSNESQTAPARRGRTPKAR